MMPGIDGFETCRRLKASSVTADIPVIFITAQNETESVVEGFQVGGVDYITKPFRHEEVRARARTHLTIKGLRDALEKSYSQLETDNLRKTEELETARAIQQAFLPISPPDVSYLEIAAFQKPATEVGGDYYDFFPQAEGKLLLAIGDATGHGAGSGLMVSATKTALMTVEAPDLAKRIGKINTLLKRVNRDRLLNMALVLMELAYDANANTVQVNAAGGGMPAAYIHRSSAAQSRVTGADGSVKKIMIRGMPLGAMEKAKYSSTAFQLEKSDVLILMSDGLPERLNDKDEMLDNARLTAEIERVGKEGQSVSGILEALVKLGDDWSNHTPQGDDVTLVVLKVK